MLKRERQAIILHKINLHNKILSTELCKEMGVSEDTMRRDLQELSDQGKLIKVHGGALSHSFSQVNFLPSTVYSQANKAIIAKKAASLIKDGMFVLTSGGTTILELARALPPGLKATFICGSIPTVLEYMKHPSIDVVVIGDKVSKNSRITVGAEAINQIRRIKADLCFLGVNAIDLQHGVTDNDWDVVMIKRAMIEASQKLVCLTIAEKMNSFQPLHICDLADVDILVTELNASDPSMQPYVAADIQVL
ncbi:DeoR/GlpR family DNA-binding transcription regulator [Flavihumibacter sediminis]|nr:DeoR/GlpR family DNA-binding transcription regulator [Flavihumibacter sediminis]